MMMQPRLRFIDIGINLTDDQYQGNYHNRNHHPSDLDSAIKRAQGIGCEKLIITGSDLAESKHAIEIARGYPETCFTTAGVHPCSIASITQYEEGPGAYLNNLRELLESRSEANLPIVALGEIGLDYDRLHYTPKELQLRYFEAQLDIACSLSPPLPLFLHSRAAPEDFEGLLRKHLDRLPRRGVVHSFTGSGSEMERLVDLGFDIGVNGCSLKTEENLEVVRTIPLGSIQLETDGPWCEIRPSHASSKYIAGAGETEPVGYVPQLWDSVKKEKWTEGKLIKGRNESCRIGEVAAVVAAIKGISVQQLADHAWENSTRMFKLS